MKTDEQQNADAGEAKETSFDLVESATEQMTRGEINSQIQTAHQFPRSMEKFTKRALSMATFDEETAESCLYRRPVGKENGQPVFAEGMSVRMAEIVGASYGNLRVYATIISQTPRQVVARGMAIDLESNFASSSECIESTVGRDGRPYSERQAALIAKVALAKARRDATFQVVPRALAKPIEAAVRKVLSGGSKTLAQRRAAVLKWINLLAIEPARVWAALNIQGEADLGEEQLVTLSGIKTAIVDKDTTIDEAFPPIKASSAPKTESDKTVIPPNGATPQGTGATLTPKTGTQTPPAPQNAPQNEPEKFKEAVLNAKLDPFQLYRWLRKGEFVPDMNPATVTLSEIITNLPPKQIGWLLERFEAIKADVLDLMAEADAGLTAQAPTTEAKPEPTNVVTLPPADTKAPETEKAPLDESPLGMLRTKTKEAGLTEDQVIGWARSAKKIAAGVSTFDGVIETSPSVVTYMVNSFSKIEKAIKGGK